MNYFQINFYVACISNDQIIEKVSPYNYLGNYMDYDKNTMPGKSQMICGTINCKFRNEVCRETKLKFC